MNELQYEEVVERLAGRRADLEPIARRMEAIPGELVDENDVKKRQALIGELDGLQRQERIIPRSTRVWGKRRSGAYASSSSPRSTRVWGKPSS